MGSSESKISKQNPENTVHTENNPKKRLDDLDPRSPSSYLSRTPLQLLSEIPGRLELNENKLYELESETPAKNTLMLGIDPRSPTTEFKRTPIVINVEESDVPKKIRNKNFDKVRQTIIMATPKATEEKTKNIVPPKLLESSPVAPKPEINKRKSFVGLLETNIDFTETDLDAVIQEKYRIKEKVSDNLATPIKEVQDGLETESNDPRSPTNDFLRTPICFDSNLEETKEKEQNDESEPNEVVVETDLVDKIEAEVTVHKICETIQVVTETALEKSTEVENDSSQVDDLEPEAEIIPEEAEIESNVSVETDKSEPPTEIKSAPITPRRAKNEDVVVCPRIVKLREHVNRSPLRNCNGVELERKKSVQKLKVSDRPRKLDYAVSKIPVFKEKGRGQVQCENTPPRGMEKRKGKKSQWDNADKTLVI
ncbi:hypothetical protein NQ318_020066 [Aromia moschata]|uniref:Uncharacterized protein n=1 Tax=Aromia moschata TaxID=1265417 RepID=A0AAV8Z908_9CUCU|nr:hypothetical protein NQ318_020066 [Aromia moschata]